MPVVLPNQFLRWKFVDPYDPTLNATFEFPRNPNQMGTPFPRRNITATGVTAINGRTIAIEGQAAPTEWTFGGNIHNSTHYEELRSWVYGRRGRKVFLYDHFGRRLTIVPLLFNPIPKRTPSQYWRHTYEITALVFDITGPTFRVELPGPPRNFAIADKQSLRAALSWNAPASAGGSKLLGYHLTNITKNKTVEIDIDDLTSYVWKDLTAGTFQFALSAFSAAGDGPEVTVSGAVDRKRAPSGHVIQRCVVGRDYLYLTWSNITDDGGEPLRGWQVALESTTGANIGAQGSYRYGADVREARITGLTPNAKYTVYLYAQNGIGSLTIPQQTKRLVTTLK